MKERKNEGKKGGKKEGEKEGNKKRHYIRPPNLNDPSNSDTRISALTGASHCLMSDPTTMTLERQKVSESPMWKRRRMQPGFFSTAKTRIGTPVTREALRAA